MHLLIQFSFGSIWASVEGYPLAWVTMTAAGLFLVVQTVRALRNGEAALHRGRILGAGIVALLVGSLVFPYEAIMGIRALQIAEEAGGALSLVLGGFYLPLYPFVYGLLWFITGLGMWGYLKKRADS